MSVEKIENMFKQKNPAFKPDFLFDMLFRIILQQQPFVESFLYHF